MKLKPIEQLVVVIIGASSGIGRVTALRFAARGVKLILAARGQQGLSTLVDEIRRRGGEAKAVTCDVLHFEQVKAVADAAFEIYGRIDTWVHLAAASIYATFEQTTPEEFKQIIDTNLTGQAYGAMAALPHLKRKGRGALIHISSVEARRALPYQSAYASSKHGIKGFLEALRMELAREGTSISITEVMMGGSSSKRTAFPIPYSWTISKAKFIKSMEDSPTRLTLLTGKVESLSITYGRTRRRSMKPLKHSSSKMRAAWFLAALTAHRI